MPRRTTVATRLLVSFLAVMVAFAVTVGFSVVAQRRAARDSELLRSGYVPLLLSLGAALENQNLVSAQLNHITEAKNPADAWRWIETARRVRPKVFADIRQAVRRGVLPIQEEAATEVGAHILSDSASIEAFLAEDGEELGKLFDALANDDIELAERVRDHLMAHEIEGARRLRELKGRVDGELDRLTAGARQRERRSIESLLVLACLTLAVGGVMSLYARRVLRPLVLVTERAHAVAAGDLRPHPVVEARDEIGELASTFESMVGAIAKANHDRLQAERLAVVGRMAAHVTHEIRNPLSSIGLNLELLEEELALGDSSSESLQLVQAIRREVDHLSALSEEYLSLARPHQPQLGAESLGELLLEVTSFLEPELMRAGVKLELVIPEEVSDVLIDEAQIRQAISNLIRNAREAMPKGGTLRIGLKQLDSRRVEFQVEDTGQGIPEAIRQNIFDPFFTTKARGTGLGLAITRQIIEAHHGSIECEAAQSGGTRFRVVLPAVALAQAGQ